MTCNNLGEWKTLTQSIAKAFPDVRHEIGGHIDSGDTGVVEFRLVGTHKGPLATAQGEVPPTGRPINVRMVRIERAESGKIVDGSLYFDQVELMTQLGLMPEPAAAT
jgi:predicted ester cyclase